MSLSEIVSFDKEGRATSTPFWRVSLQERLRPLFLALVIILTALLAFGLGRLSRGGAGEAVRIEYNPLPTANNLPPTTASAASARVPRAGEVVGSRSGSKYHYPSCPGAKQIKEENKIYFPSAEEAEKAGYTLAANCKLGQ